MAHDRVKQLENTVNQLRISNKSLRAQIRAVKPATAFLPQSEALPLGTLQKALTEARTHDLGHIAALQEEVSAQDQAIARLATANTRLRGAVQNVVDILKDDSYTSGAAMLSDLRALFGVDSEAPAFKPAHGSVEADHPLNKENGQR